MRDERRRRTRRLGDREDPQRLLPADRGGEEDTEEDGVQREAASHHVKVSAVLIHGEERFPPANTTTPFESRAIAMSDRPVWA